MLLVATLIRRIVSGVTDHRGRCTAALSRLICRVMWLELLLVASPKALYSHYIYYKANLLDNMAGKLKLLVECRVR